MHHEAQVERKRTARKMNSTNLLLAERPKAVEIAEAQEEVSSVVVLCMLVFVTVSREEGAYSFAKTPLNAAQAPLSAASGIQGSLLLLAGGSNGVREGGMASGMRGSAAGSMVLYTREICTVAELEWRVIEA